MGSIFKYYNRKIMTNLTNTAHKRKEKSYNTSNMSFLRQL